MRARFLVGALALVTLAFGASPPARAQSISAMTADLQALQAKIAAGDKAAYAAQAERLAAIGAAIAAAKPEVWRNQRETDAAVVYLLSGGQAREVAQLLQSGAAPSSETSLLRGAIAYVVGDEANAAALLKGVDVWKLRLPLAGQVAYAQAVLAAKDAKKALALLDFARLISPGTLVEEAALRREALLAVELRDIDRVASLARQYATRFGRSVYADNFIQGAATAIVEGGLVDDLANFEKLRVFVSSLAPDARRGFLLTVARAEALNGKFPVVGAAAAEALRGAPSDSADEARGKLYEGAARILTAEYDAGLAELQSVAASRLDRRDQALLEAVRGVAAGLREPPAASDAARETASTAGPAPDQADDEAAKTIALAQAALDRAAALAGVVGKESP